jgi:hypothetical protein
MRILVLEGENDDCTIYQCPELKNFPVAVSFYSTKHEEYVCAVAECIKSRLSWSDARITCSAHIAGRKLWKRIMTWQPSIVSYIKLQGAGAGAETGEVVREFTEMTPYSTST